MNISKKMQELENISIQNSSAFNKTSNEIKNVEKFLKNLNLTESCYVLINEHESIGYEIERKRLMYLNDLTGEYKPLIETKIAIRIKAFSNLETLIDFLICKNKHQKRGS